MIEFINDLILWLENCVVCALTPFIKELNPKAFFKRNRNYLIDESAISNDFKITEAGDIFRRDMDKNPLEQLGH